MPIARSARKNPSTPTRTSLTSLGKLGGALIGSGQSTTAWRHSEALLVPLRPAIRHLARALLVHPRYLPYPVAAALVTPLTPAPLAER